MKEEFVIYIRSIGITVILQKRIEEIYEFYEKICPDEITDIFVTDYIKDDVSREYENLWFFSKKYCMEAKGFTVRDEFDMVPIRKRVVGWDMQKKDYDFKTATSKSRITLVFKLLEGVGGTLKAASMNCDYLKDIFLKHIIQNLQE